MFTDLGRCAKLVSLGDDIPHLGANVVGGVVAAHEGRPVGVRASPKPEKS